MNAKWIAAMAMAAIINAPAHAGKADAALDAKAVAIIKSDFHDKGIARAERVNQDELQALCTKFRDKPLRKDQQRIESQQMKLIKWPDDGKYLGDWKAGEKLAQSGSGMTWSDKAGVPAGGNCYNCHQLSAQEISYGTIGPSLLHFGRTHGNSEEIQRYAYGVIYNAKAYHLCANMPRFGHMGILTETQIKDLVALLLDPESLVNRE